MASGSWRGPQYVSALALRLLLGPTLGALGSDDSAMSIQQAAALAQRLLPSLVAAARTLGGRLNRLTLAAVWERCRSAHAIHNGLHACGNIHAIVLKRVVHS